MNRCPLTYKETTEKYSLAGLKKISPKLTTLNDIPFSTDELYQEIATRATKMSIQGVQPKLNAKLNTKDNAFNIVTTNGKYILKPQNNMYPELPQNEDASMKIAKTIGIETPLHGLIYTKDQSLVYFIKRFDRLTKSKKAHLEDFAQLSMLSRDTKYDSSLEKVAKIIEQYCTFPAIEKTKLYKRVIFNFLIGNEDMHLKNYSIIIDKGIIRLSPAYDFLNTTIALRTNEESALPIQGKKKKLSKKILIDYLAYERLGLSPKITQQILDLIYSELEEWERIINICFLSDNLKEKYIELVHSRAKTLFHN